MCWVSCVYCFVTIFDADDVVYIFFTFPFLPPLCPALAWLSRIKQAEEALAREQAKAKEESQSKDVDIEFQSKLNKDAFMNSSTSMAERLSQRKHYRERLGDE